MSIYVAGNATLLGVTPRRGEGALGTVIALRTTPNRDTEPENDGKRSLGLFAK